MEHSERERYVTEQVSMWIVNDGDHYFTAQEAAREGVTCMSDYLTGVLKSAEEYTAAWYTAQDLSPNDYGRIDWSSVAEDLLAS